MVALLWLGLYPQPVIDTFKPATNQVQYVLPLTRPYCLLPSLGGTTIVVMLAIAVRRSHGYDAS